MTKRLNALMWSILVSIAWTLSLACIIKCLIKWIYSILQKLIWFLPKISLDCTKYFMFFKAENRLINDSIGCIVSSLETKAE